MRPCNSIRGSNQHTRMTPPAREDFIFNKLCLNWSNMFNRLIMGNMGSQGRRFSKWRRMVRQLRGKLYIMRVCISMLLNWHDDS